METFYFLGIPEKYNYANRCNNGLDSKPHLGKTSILVNFLLNNNIIRY